MTFEEAMGELQSLGSEQTKKTLISHGAREPIFGVRIGDMKPMANKAKKDQALAELLYATGNYDAMYLAGMVSNPGIMEPEDFERWIAAAYSALISDNIVAVALAEAPCAQDVADRWIASGLEPQAPTGWACYELLLGWKPDGAFEQSKIRSMLDKAEREMLQQPISTRSAMNGFVAAVGIFYQPLHDEALKAAAAICELAANSEQAPCRFANAFDLIQKAKRKGRIGIKRRTKRR